MVKALSALSARAGIAVARQHKIALNWAMIKIAPEQGRAVMAKPATANINLALAIRVINTPAPAPVTPAVPALLVAENTRNALVNRLILGHQEPVNVHQLTNTLAPAPAIPVALALPAVVNIQNAPAPAAMSGKMVVARNKSSMVQLAICIIAMVRWLALMPAV